MGRGMKVCLTCGSDARRLIHGECGTCSEYRRRNGSQRPIALIVAHARRVFEREEHRKWLRRLAESA